MDTDTLLAISTAGMNLERARAEAAALNLANAHTSAATAEAAYKPVRVIAGVAGSPDFSGAMAAAARGLQPVFELRAADIAPRRVYEPGHPHADAAGFVNYPRVDPAVEMMALMRASRAYEANLAAFDIARGMALKALEIGAGT